VAVTPTADSMKIGFGSTARKFDDTPRGKRLLARSCASRERRVRCM
jgi:hypothetical protein